MGVDLDAIRKKLDQLNKDYSGGKSQEWFEVEPGDNWMRIVPALQGKLPFREVGYHFKKVGEKSRGYLCPRITFDKPCPVCEALEKLRNQDSKWTESDKALAKMLTPTVKAIWGVVSRSAKNDPTKVHFFISTSTVYKKFLSYFADPAYGDISDPNNGRDMCVIKGQKANVSGPLGTTYDVKPAANSSPICQTAEQYATISSQLVEFDSLLNEVEYADLNTKFFGDDDDEPSGSVGAHLTSHAPAPVPQFNPQQQAQQPPMQQQFAAPAAAPVGGFAPPQSSAAPQPTQQQFAAPQQQFSAPAPQQQFAPPAPVPEGAKLSDDPGDDVSDILAKLKNKKKKS